MAKLVTLAGARIALAAILVCGNAASADAASEGFWHGVRDNIWNNGKLGGVSNWYTMAPQGGKAQGVPTSVAKFAVGALSTQVELAKTTTIDTLQFLSGVEDYRFLLMDQEFRIQGDGIANDASSTPTFEVDGDSKLRFLNAAMISGNAVINVDGFGETIFEGDSKGGSAVLSGNGNSRTTFLDNASADRMVITNNDSGLTAFRDTSTGGMAEFINDGRLDFSPTRGPDNDFAVTAGSITNSGALLIGDNTLTVQQLTLDTEGVVHIDVTRKRAGSIVVNKKTTLAGLLNVAGDGQTKRTRVVLIRALGGRSGKFDSVEFTDGFTARGARIEYQGKEVVMMLDPLSLASAR